MTIYLNDYIGSNVLVPFGKQGEYGKEVAYDFSAWTARFGEGTIGWEIKRSADINAYLLPSTEEGNVSVVTLTETETEYAGQGCLEVFYVNAGETEKRISETFKFGILPSLQDLGEVPAPWQPYVDAVHEDAVKAEEAASSILDLTATATVDSSVGTPSVSVEVTTEDDHKNMAFAFSNIKGEQGEQGETGNGISSVSVEKTATVENVDTYTMTITHPDGDSDTATFDVTNSEVTEEEFEKAFPVDVAQGSIASYPDGADMPIKDLKVAVTPVQNLNGYANPWVSSDNDQVPYLIRPTTDATVADVGNHEMDTIVGGSIAWNQLQPITASDKSGTYSDIAITDNRDGTFTLNGVASSTTINLWLLGAYSASNNVVLTYRLGHVYYCRDSWGRFPTNDNTGTYNYVGNETLKSNGYFVKATSADYRSRAIRFPSAVEGTTYTGKAYPQIMDLTQMFGTSVADYIYSLESATTGAGVAFFRSLFPSDYYPYNAGEMLHVNASAHKTYDANDNLIGNYPLDSDLVLRGIPKLDANNHLYYDGDTYASDGTVTRRYGFVDMGTLTWTYQEPQNRFTSSTLSSTMKRSPSGRNADWIMCAKYVADINSADKTIFIYTGGEIYIYDSAYTDADAFTDSLNGVYLVYELATPTTESADPYTGTQVIVADGSEQYTVTAQSGVSVPVGHKSYYANICPITGWTGANVVRTGANLYNYALTTTDGAPKSGTAESFTVAEGYVNYARIEFDVMHLKGLGNFYFSCKAKRTGTSANALCSRLSYNDGTTHYQNFAYYTNNECESNDVVFSVPSNAVSAKIILFVNNSTNTGANISATFTDVRITSRPNTAYAPYVGNAYSFDFGTTVYGGTLDVTTGVLTVDKAMVDLGTLTFQLMNNTSARQAWHRKFTDAKPIGGNDVINAISSQFVATSANATWKVGDMAFDTVNSTFISFCVESGKYASHTEFESAMSGVQFLYELATPQTVQLTPTEVKSLLGQNNIFADCGDSEVEYLADVTLYIQKLTGSTEEDMVANQNIANNKYFMVGNRLFFSTSAIAQGASIVVGTNCTETNLADALNALNS